jgi:hypothetical protein
MANSIRIALMSYPGGGASPEYIDTATYATPALAITAISTGTWLTVIPSTPYGAGSEESTSINVANIKYIVQT